VSGDVAFWADIIDLQHKLVTNASWLLARAERMAGGREASVRLAEHVEQCRAQLVETRATLERHIVKAYEAGWRPHIVDVSDCR
jgi:hypothetical protein